MRKFAIAVLALAFSAAGSVGTVLAERYITVGSDVTEIVFALGAGPKIVAVDSTSTFPPAAEDLPNIGYMRQLSAEPLIAMSPKLILLSEGAGPPEVIDQLLQSGLSVQIIPDDPSPEGLYEKIALIGQAIGLDDKAETLAGEVRDVFSELATFKAKIQNPPKALLTITAGQGRVLAAGRNSSGDSIIRLAGGINAISDFEGYKPLSAEAAIEAAPEVIIVPSHVMERFENPSEFLGAPQFALTPAAKSNSLVVVDSLLLLGFGPRLPNGAIELAEKFIELDKRDQ